MVFTLVLVLAQGVAVPQLPTTRAPQVTVASASFPAAPSSLKAPDAPGISVTTSPASTVPATALIEPVRPVKSPQPTTPGSKRAWMALTIAQHSAATFDAWTTRRKMGSGGYHENNPLLRPFAGNGSLYAAVQITPAVFDFLGNRMRTSDRPWLRRFWWLPQVAQTGTHLVCGSMNLAK